MLANLLAQTTPLVLGTAINSVFTEQQEFSLPLVPDSWLPTDQIGLFWLTFGLILTLSFGSVLFQAAQDWLWGKFAQNLQHEVRMDAYEMTQQLDVSFYDNSETGEIMSVLNNDVNQLEEFFMETVPTGIRVLVMTVGIGALMLLYHWQLAVVTLSVIPFMIFLVQRFDQTVASKYRRKREKVGLLNGLLENNITGVETIKVYGTEQKERERVEKSSTEYKESAWETYKTRIMLLAVAVSGAEIAYAITFLVGGYWVINGPPFLFTQQLAVGTLVAFLLYTNRFQGPLMQFSDVFDSYQGALAAASRIINVHEYDTSIENPDNPVELDTCVGHVEYENVTFTYEDSDPAVENVSFKSEPQEFVGIVGSTGSGKSTLMKLLPRLYDPDEGSIRIDGNRIDEQDLHSLRQNIGYVSQEPYLFNSTVAENIAYGSAEEMSNEEIKRAAIRAGAHEFISTLPNGYETEVGERGVKLSGGQRQRIAIARAIVLDPKILILDEATSHVDNKTEAVIQRHMSDLISNRTTFVIAHRLSTVKDADNILVMKDGEIVEQGNHEQLLNEDGLYANLWNIQIGATESPAERVDIS